MMIIKLILINCHVALTQIIDVERLRPVSGIRLVLVQHRQLTLTHLRTVSHPTSWRSCSVQDSMLIQG